jgi:predicted nucleic acid-binding protein
MTPVPQQVYSALRIRPVLIDASIWIEAFRPGGDPVWRNTVYELLTAERAAVCEVVIAEVLRGARSDDERILLTEDLEATVVLSMAGAGMSAGQLALQLRRSGLSMSTTDLLIAATAALHDAVLLHRDQHLAQAAAVLGLEEYQLSD